MNSLRTRLLVWLAVFHVAAALIIAGITYLTASYWDHTFMDGQMQALSTSYLHGRAPAVPAAPDGDGVQQWGTMIVQLWDARGRLLGSSWPQAAVPLAAHDGFQDVRQGDARWRVHTARSPQTAVQIIQSGDFRATEIGERAMHAALVVLLLLPVSTGLLWLAVRWSVSPLHRLGTLVASRDETNLAPLPTQGVADEIGPLVTAFNGLLQRLGAAFETQSRFVQDAAHELRTPIMALRVHMAELGERALDPSLAGVVHSLQTATSRLARLVDQLLSLARADHADSASWPDVCDIADIVKTSIEDMLPLADARGIDLGMGACVSVRLFCHEEAMRSLLRNLIDNAIRYSGAGGLVTVTITEGPAGAHIVVSDDGPGIPEEWLARAYDRFFRVPGAEAGGSGLGLSIAQRAAALNRFTLSLANRPDHAGLVATVWVPRQRLGAGVPAPRSSDGT